MHIKKGLLETLFQVTNGTGSVLTLSEARVRDRFMKSVLAETQSFEAERKAIYERFCDKNAEGEPDVTNDQYKFASTVLKEMNTELTTLYDEEVSIDVHEGIKAILEKTEYKPKVGESEKIDELFTKFN